MMMKAILLTFALLTGLNTYAQQVDSLKAAKDTSAQKPMYIVDGIVSEAEQASKVNPDSIFRIDILKEDKASQVSHLRRDVILITTKAAAVEHYKKKLAGKSALYRDYLAKHNNSDARVIYVLNDREIPDADKAKRLFEIKEDDILKVDFKGGKKPVVKITERAAKQ